MELLKKLSRFVSADGGSLKARIMRSAFWVGLQHIGITLLTVIRSIALARILTPEIFGLMGIATVVLRATDAFTRPGVGQALIARQKDFEEAAGTAFSMLVARGVFLAAVMCALAPVIAHFYEEAELGPMLFALSAVFVVNSFSNINIIARQRELDFKRQSLLSQATNVIGAVITIGMAWWLRSVWALVIGQIAQAAINTLLSYVFIPGRVRFAFDKEVFKDLIGYGKFVTGSSLLLYICTELDTAVIGKILGPEQLGYYALAMTISTLVTITLTRIASSIMMPAYSKLQTDFVALRAAYLRVLSIVMMLVLQASIGLAVVAHPFVDVVYGEKWLPAVLPLQMLAIFGIFRALMSFAGYLFEGIGHPEVAFKLGAMRLVALAPLIVPFVMGWGNAGAALAVTLGGLVQWAAGFYYLNKFVQITPKAIFGTLWRPLWTSLIMGAAVYGMGYLVNANSIPGLAAVVAVGFAVFVVLNIRVLKSYLPKRKAAA
jgi:O-antigen/teichoic acid export membrane protein